MNDFDFNTIISAAFTGAIERATAPLLDHIKALDARINLLSSQDVAMGGRIELLESVHLSADIHAQPLRVDALYSLLGTLIETDDEAIETAKQGDVLPPTFRLRQSFINFLREEVGKEARIDLSSDEFEDAVQAAVESRSDDIGEALMDSMKSAREEKIRDAVIDALENGSFKVDFRRY